MLIWAGNFHVVKIALDTYSPIAVATWRFLFGVITLFAISYFRQGEYPFSTNFTNKEWWYLFLTGFFGIFLTIYFFNVGLKTTSAINGSLIVATTPAITGLFAIFFLQQRLNLKQWLAIGVSFIGVAIILLNGNLAELVLLNFEIGDIYILGMVVAFSLSQIIIIKYLSHIDSIKLTTICSVFALLLFGVFSLPELFSKVIPTSPSFWYSILFMGVLGSGLAYTAFYLSVIKLGATVSSLSMNLIAFFAVLLAFPFGEKILLVQLVGGMFVVIGVLIFSWKEE